MVGDNYGIEEDDSDADNNNDDDDNEGVSIPHSTVQLSDEQLRGLHSRVNYQTDDDNHRINLYQQILEYLNDQ